MLQAVMLPVIQALELSLILAPDIKIELVNDNGWNLWMLEHTINDTVVHEDDLGG
jgi:hypothetical protein